AETTPSVRTIFDVNWPGWRSSASSEVFVFSVVSASFRFSARGLRVLDVALLTPPLPGADMGAPVAAGGAASSAAGALAQPQSARVASEARRSDFWCMAVR